MRPLPALMLVVCALPLGARASGQDTGPDILRDYRNGIEPVVSQYKQVKIQAVLVRKDPGVPAVTYDADMTEQDQRMKLVTRRTDTGSSTIQVAHPTISFVAKLSPDKPQPTLDFLSQRRGHGYDAIHGQLSVVSMCLRPHYCYFEMPLTELLSKPEISPSRGDSPPGSVRVNVRIQPFDDLGKLGMDSGTGWFLFDRNTWCLQEYDVRLFKAQKAFMDHFKMKVEYSPVTQGPPRIKRAHHQQLNAAGEVVSEQSAEVKSIEFGPVPDEEFTMRGCGLSDLAVGSLGSLPIAVYASVGVGAAAVVGLVVWRRKARVGKANQGTAS